MSWLPAHVFRRYRDHRARQHAAQAPAAPPALHPALGLGGRSIELSIASDVPPAPGAFELAAERLHDQMMQRDHDRDDLVRAAHWLRDLWPQEASASVLARLDDDLDVLAHRW